MCLIIPNAETIVQHPSKIIKGKYFINIEARQASPAPKNSFANKPNCLSLFCQSNSGSKQSIK